VTYKYKNKRNN